MSTALSMKRIFYYNFGFAMNAERIQGFHTVYEGPLRFNELRVIGLPSAKVLFTSPGSNSSESSKQ
jgi:hypothetical protein